MVDWNSEACAQIVSAILDARQSQRHPDGKAWVTVTGQLVALPAECIPALREIPSRWLESSPAGDEGELHLALLALTRLRDPGAADLLVRAIEHRYTMQKEFYVSFLEDLDEHERGESALMTVLALGRNDGDRPDLGVTIRALHARHVVAALPDVAWYVRHLSDGIRGAAIDFLFSFDESGTIAGPVFLEQLGGETEPDLLTEIIDGLGSWEWTPAFDQLHAIADDQDQPDAVRDAARRALPSD